MERKWAKRGESKIWHRVLTKLLFDCAQDFQGEERRASYFKGPRSE
jgi:hypothetical protein